MVSRVHFEVSQEGGVPIPATVDLKQTIGSQLDRRSIEVGRPQGFGGQLNHEALREAVVDYYIGLLDERSELTHLDGMALDYSLRNVEVSLERDVSDIVEAVLEEPGLEVER